LNFFIKKRKKKNISLVLIVVHRWYLKRLDKWIEGLITQKWFPVDKTIPRED
jgi:hypothetical protein